MIINNDSVEDHTRQLHFSSLRPSQTIWKNAYNFNTKIILILLHLSSFVNSTSFLWAFCCCFTVNEEGIKHTWTGQPGKLRLRKDL